MNKTSKPATQEIFRVRRNYNQWVVNQTLEDYALRFTAKNSRRWSANQVAMTALGASAFLALEAIGGAITLNYGFTNALAAILVVSAILFITGFPICYYASRYGVDIDLLTRGAGFGYLGSTITSLIYASFTFIFFAIEAVILASALDALFSIPPYIGYFISAVLVIPIVTHGITFISKFQNGSQPIWLCLQILAIGILIYYEHESMQDWINYAGYEDATGEAADQEGFNILLFGAASSVLFALIAQIGEQVDYLRFLPSKEKISPSKWWASMIIAGPGWVFVGVIKLLLGSFIAYLAIQQGLSIERASDPVYMYQMTFNYLTQSPTVALILAGIMVFICQMKINVTNAYAGSIAWSNFFSRLTHNHPGRVVWLVFNVAIALLLMELGIYRALENILGLFAIVAVSWLGTISADLMINKTLGLSPPGIEFKRSHLYDINPVGIGSLTLSSIVGFLAYLGTFGDIAQALTHFVTLGMTFLITPCIALITRGQYYIARQSTEINTQQEHHQCCICEHEYEHEDMSYCPVYQGNICSLCCSLDARCLDTCKNESRVKDQISNFLSTFLPEKITQLVQSRFMHFFAVLSLISLVNAGLLALVYYQIETSNPETSQLLAEAFWILFFILLIISGVLSWLFLLAHGSRIVAQEESHRQTKRLMEEIDAHTHTDRALQDAIQKAESANQAKSRYLSGISHELRTPLQTILGYAQILGRDNSIPSHRRESINIIQRSGDYLADLIEGLLDVSKIEAGKLDIRRDEMDFHALMNQLELMFRPQADAKNIDFEFMTPEKYPRYVIADEKRVRQILINLLSNAIKFTSEGKVSFELRYKNQVAEFIVSDTGIGINETNLETIFHPFERVVDNQGPQTAGTGLGLTIVHLLADIMGGEVKVHSQINQGSTFTVSLMLSRIDDLVETLELTDIQGYEGERKNVYVVDDQPSHRQLLKDLLEPLGFLVIECQNAKECINSITTTHGDIFLLDVSMPDINGLELARILRQRNISKPIIMISADAQEHHQIDAPETYHNFYMVKPIKVQALLDKMGALMNIHWKYQHNSSLPISSAAQKNWQVPDHPYISQLIAYAEIGYAKGFNEKLIMADDENLLPNELIQHLYQLAKQVRFDKIKLILNQKEL